MSDDLAALREYRDLRQKLETAVLSMATSVDGLRFEYQASLHGLELAAGGYVLIETETDSRLGQLQSLRMEQQEAWAVDRPGTIVIRCARGEGAIVGGDARPFHDAPIRPATSDEVAAWLSKRRLKGSSLEIGELALAAGRAVCARCGSDSGATRSSAGSRARGRPTHSASCSSSC